MLAPANLSSSKKQILDYSWVLLETKHLTMGYLVTLQPKLLFGNLALSDTLNHKMMKLFQMKNRNSTYKIKSKKVQKLQVKCI